MHLDIGWWLINELCLEYFSTPEARLMPISPVLISGLMKIINTQGVSYLILDFLLIHKLTFEFQQICSIFFFVHQWNVRSNDLKRSSLNGLVGKIGRSITIWNNCDEFFFRNGMDEKDSKLRGSALVALGKLGQKLPEAVTKDMAIIQMLFNAMETVIIIF